MIANRNSSISKEGCEKVGRMLFEGELLYELDWAFLEARCTVLVVGLGWSKLGIEHRYPLFPAPEQHPIN